MMQVTSIQDLGTAINQNGEMEDIKKSLLKAEDDIRKGKVKDAREVFKEWKKKYGI